LVVIDWQEKIGALGPSPEVMATPESIEKTALVLNFNLVEKFSAGLAHYGLIFKK